MTGVQWALALVLAFAAGGCAVPLIDDVWHAFQHGSDPKLDTSTVCFAVLSIIFGALTVMVAT